MATLRVRKGKNSGAVFTVHDSVKPTLIGRDPSTNISLDDERASRKHSRVLRAFGSWIIQDLGSSNGTLLEGKRIDKARIEDGASIQVGNTLFSFHADHLPPPSSREVYGTRLLTVLHEEGGVLVHRAFQAAMDREVRVDRLASGWRLPGHVYDFAREAIDEASKISHPGVDSLLHGAVQEGEKCYVVLRIRAGETLSSCFDDILEEPLAVRVGLFRSLVDILLSRAVWEKLRSPIGLHQITLVRDEDGSLSASVPALELPALVTERTGGLSHLPTYTPYLPPELNGPGSPPETIAFSSTMYVLGAIGYHILTGQPPMGEGPVRKTLENHKKLVPAPAGLLCPALPEEASDLLNQMLDKDPGRRPAGRLELVSVLEATESRLLEAFPPALPKARSGPAPVVSSAVAGDRPKPAAPKPAGNGAQKSRSSLKTRRKHIPFLGSYLSLPLWLGFWAALFFGARFLVKHLLLGNL